MRAVQHANDSSFRTVPLRKPSASLNFCHHVIPMHSVFNSHTRNKHVAVEPGNWFIGNHETVTVVVQHESSTHFITAESFFASAGVFRTRVIIPGSRGALLNANLRRFS